MNRKESAVDAGCIFCKIIAGEIPAQFVHRDDDIAVIVDVNAQAPKHVLIMPIKHVANLPAFVQRESPEALAKFLSACGNVGAEQGGNGFRVVFNTGIDGGQTVDHLHAHVLAGRHLTWPPG
jgi:histidine triad (HIT) family protein